MIVCPSRADEIFLLSSDKDLSIVVALTCRPVYKFVYNFPSRDRSRHKNRTFVCGTGYIRADNVGIQYIIFYSIK